MKNKIIILVLAAFFFVVAISVWQSKSQAVLAGMHDFIAAEITNAAGSAVQFGDIEAVSYNTVIIHNVSIFDKATKLVASSDKVVVSFSPLSLFFGQTANMISTVSLEQPVFNLQQHPSGRWNFEDLLDKDRPSEFHFSGKILVNGGRAEISGAAGQWTLREIEGRLDVDTAVTTSLELSSVLKDTPFTISGNINKKGDGVLTLKAKNLEVTDVASFIPEQGSLQIVSGKASALDATAEIKQGEVNFAGEAMLTGAAVNIDKIPVRDINGLVTFTNKDLYLFTRAKVYEQPVTASGKILLNAGDPVMSLRVTSPGFDPLMLKADIPVSGLIAFDANLAGAASDLTIDGEVHIAKGMVAGVNVQDIRAKLRLAENILTIAELKGTVAGGQVAASGRFSLIDNTYQLRVKGTGIDSTQFSGSVPGLSGAVDIDAAASGSGRSLDEALVYGTAAMASGSYGEFDFHSVQASFYFANEKLTLDYLNFGLEKGTVTASGTAAQDNINLTVRGQQVPLKLISSKINQEQLDGTADFAGVITGTRALPSLTLDFSAVNGQVLCQPFSSAQGNLTATPESVTLNAVELRNGQTTHKVQGTVQLSGDRQVNLNVTTSKARAENLVTLLLPGERLTGNVDNEVTLSGPLNNINVSGKIKLTEGSFRGQLVAKAEGSYKRENGITSISDFVISSLDTDIRLSGIMGAGNDLDLNVTAQNLDVSRLKVSLPYQLAGKANFNGKLTGTPSAPLFDGHLTADSLLFKDQQFNQVNGDILLAGDMINIPKFTFLQGGGCYNFAGNFDLASGSLYGMLDVQKGELGALFSLLNIPAKEVSGLINGQVALSGTITKPNVGLTGKITNGKIKNYPLEKVEIDISLENNIVTVNKFIANQGVGVLAVNGTADLNGPLNFEAGGRDIDAGLLPALFNANVDVKGKLNFAAQVSGSAHNPEAAVSLEIKNGEVAAASFDSLYGLMILKNDSIHVNQLMLTKGLYRASAYGVIPVAALTSEGRQQASLVDQMDLKVRLDEANLSILPFLTKEVSWASGQTQGQVTISGTLAQPYLTGNVSVKDGVLKLAKLGDPIQKVALDIVFEGDKIVLKTFSGHMGSGSYALTGSARINGLALSDYNFQLGMDKLGINSKYFKGPLDGNLILTSSAGRPKLSGKLFFEHDVIDIPYVTDLADSDFNLGLDLEFVAGNKVRLYNSYMYDIWAEGKVKFTGSVKRPIPSGRITAIRGTVSYLRTQFKIKEGSADFIQFGSFMPVVKLNASTKLQDTVVNLNIYGPASTMEFQLNSEPAMSQQEILSLLTLRSRYFEKQGNGSSGSSSGLGRDEIVSFLDAGLQMRFISEVEGAFREALGLDDFRVVRDTLWSDSGSKKSSDDRDNSVGREVYNLEVGKYITDRLMLNYTMGVDHDQHSFGFRYDLNRRISLTGMADNKNTSRIGIETRFRF